MQFNKFTLTIQTVASIYTPTKGFICIMCITSVMECVIILVTHVYIKDQKFDI